VTVAGVCTENIIFEKNKKKYNDAILLFKGGH